MKPIYKFIGVGILMFSVFRCSGQGFKVNDTLVGMAGVIYADPEFSSHQKAFVFQTLENNIRKVYLGKINASNGQFTSGHGKDILLDSYVAMLGNGQQTNNGPEWGLDKDGPSVFYQKNGTGDTFVQVWRADNLFGVPVLKQMTRFSQGGTNSLVREDLSLSTTAFVFRRTNNDLAAGPLMWMDDSDSNSAVQVPGFSTASYRVAWIPGSEDFIYLRLISSTESDFYYFNAKDKTSTPLFSYPGEKREPFAFHEPGLGGELIIACVLDNTKMAFFRKSGNMWGLWKTLSAPDTNYAYLRSPELFQTKDRTYFVTRQADVNGFPSNSALWVLGLDATGDNHLYRRIDIGAENGVVTNRAEPEVYEGSNEFLVYYNAQGRLRVCMTGIKTESTTSVEPFLSLDRVSLYPNPAREMVTITNLPSSFIAWVRIYDPQGQVIHSEQKSGSPLSIRTAHLRNGCYFIQIINEQGQCVSRKLLIE
jgi:hypothetical protein